MLRRYNNIIKTAYTWKNLGLVGDVLRPLLQLKKTLNSVLGRLGFFELKDFGAGLSCFPGFFERGS